MKTAIKTIIITGTPCTGKTTISKKLSEVLNFLYLDINQILRKYKIKYSYDKKRRCKVIDTKKLNKSLIEELNNAKNYNKSTINPNKTKNTNKINGVIIDSHLSHYLPKKYVDLCIVAKCSLKILEKRLIKRGYSKKKIRENLDAEIFDVCHVESVERKHKVLIVDTSNKINYRNLIRVMNL